MRKEDFHTSKPHSQALNFSQQNSLLSKSSNLLELLKAKKGQNINIDISMLSNKGSLTNLIEKAKKYQVPPNTLLNKNLVNDSKKEDIHNDTSKKETQKSINISQNLKNKNQIEILEKFNKNRNEKNINDDAINIEENSEDTNEKTSNINSNNLNPESSDMSQKNINYNILSSKTTSSGTITKIDQISKKSDNYSHEDDDDVDSYSSNQKETSNKKYSKQTIYNINDTYYYKNNKKVKNTKINQEKYNPNLAIEYETVKDTYSIKSCNTVLEYSFREDQNIDSQPLMEDKSKSIENFNNDINQMVFELFDGHGGDDISNFLQQNFIQIYKQYLEINNYNIPKSLTYSFKEADEMIKESLTNLDGQGSTGTIIHIFWESDTKLMVYTGNVGDSRVTLISPTHIIKLSYDHRMSDEKEKKRILESGIEVIENRIGGELMLTRIFGDYEFKSNEKEKGKGKEKGKEKKKGLICEPFLSKIKIDLNIKDQFLILASDGIWDLVTEKEIQQMLEMTTNSEKLCAMIIKKALDKDAWDNMSVFVIKLT